MLQETSRSLKKDEFHEQRRATRIPTSHGMAEALYALGGRLFIQDQGTFACRGSKPAVEAGQTDPCPPPQERGLKLQVLLNSSPGWADDGSFKNGPLRAHRLTGLHSTSAAQLATTQAVRLLRSSSKTDKPNTKSPKKDSTAPT